MASTASLRAADRVAELDLLRGLAALLIVSFAWARGGSLAAAQYAATVGPLGIGLLIAWRIGPFAGKPK